MREKSRDSPTREANFTGKLNIVVVKFCNHGVVQAVIGGNVRLSHLLTSFLFSIAYHNNYFTKRIALQHCQKAISRLFSSARRTQLLAFVGQQRVRCLRKMYSSQK